MAWIKVPVLVFFFVLCTGALSQCPPPTVIHPCNCSNILFPMVDCDKIYDVDVLVQVFERSADMPFLSFALTDSSIMYLPAISLSSKKFRNIVILNSTMTALFDTHPGTDNDVSMISLANVEFQRGIGWELFGNLKKLELFGAENTEIRSLGKAFEQNMSPELTNMHLVNVKVKKIYPNAFQNLVKLFDLQIRNSLVRELKRSMFATPSALKIIDFSGNQIETLPDDLFSNMPKLKHVMFNNNKILSVSETVFGNVYDQLEEILLENNPLKCDCSVKWFLIKSRIIVTGQCDFPDDKKGHNTQDLKTADFQYCT